MELAEIEKVESHELNPGDLIVLRTARMLSMEQAAGIREAAKHYFPANRVLVLDDGMTLEVYREKSKA